MLFEQVPMPTGVGSWMTILGVGVLATALPFLIQNLAQRFTTATHAGLIYTAQPIFTLIFASLLLHETMRLQHILGAGAIISGMVIAEWKR